MRWSLGFALLLLGCARSEPQAGGPGGFAVPVVVAEVLQGPLEERLDLVASLRAQNDVSLVAEVDGTLTAIHFEEGAWVEKGQLLFELEAGRLVAAMEEADSAHRLANLSFQRAQRLLSDGTIHQQDFDEAQARLQASAARLAQAKEDVADTSIYAPFAGLVSERLVSLGQYLARGTPLLRLISGDPLEVEFHVPERYISRLSLGQAVQFTTPAQPGAAVKGSLHYLAPELRESDRSLKVKALVPNKDRTLRPGMFGQLALVVNRFDAALCIPESAVGFGAAGTTVFVLGEGNRAEQRPVELGIRQQGIAQILHGLEPGERVVTEGTQKIFPGAELNPGTVSGEAP